MEVYSRDEATHFEKSNLLCIPYKKTDALYGRNKLLEGLLDEVGLR